MAHHSCANRRWLSGARCRVGLVVLLVVCCAGRSQAGGLPAIDAYNIGRYHASAGKYNEAIKSFTEALKLNPRYTMAYLARGKAYVQVGQYVLATQDLNVAVNMAPGYAEAYVARAEALAALKQYADAIANCDAAIELDSKCARAFYVRSRVHTSCGHLGAAQVDLNEALARDPFIEDRQPVERETTVVEYQASATRSTGAPSVVPAIPSGGAVLAPSPSRPAAAKPAPITVVPAIVGPALLPQVVSKAADQTKDLRDAASIAGPQLAPPAENGDGSKTTDAAPALIEIHPGKGTTSALPVPDAVAAKLDPAADYYQRGLTDVAAEHFERAVANFGVSLRLRPGYPEALAQRGKALAQLGRWREAIADLDGAIGEYPGASDLYCTRARVCIACRDWPAAQDDLAIALRLDPGSAEAAKLKAEVVALAPPPVIVATDEPATTGDDPIVASSAPREPPASAPVMVGDAAPVTAEPVHLNEVVIAPPVVELPEVNSTAIASQPVEATTPGAAPSTPSVAALPAEVPTPAEATPLLEVSPEEQPMAPVRRAPTVEMKIQPSADSEAMVEPQRLPPIGVLAAEVLPQVQMAFVAQGAPSDRPEPIATEQPADDPLAALCQAIAASPQSAQAYVARGDLLAERAQLREAAEDYTAAIELEPNLVDAHVGRGFCALLSGCLEQAGEDFADALEIDPDHAGARYGIGKVCRLCGAMDDAICQLEESLRLDPSNEQARTELAKARHARDRARQ